MILAGGFLNNGIWRFKFSGATGSVGYGFICSRLIQTLSGSGGATVADRIGMSSVVSKLEDSLQVFDKMPSWDVVSATTIIGGFVRCNRHNEALFLFSRMMASDIRPNEFTFGTLFQIPIALLEACDGQTGEERGRNVGRLLHACAGQTGEERGGNVGRLLHACAIKMGLASNVYAGSAALNFYAKLSDTHGARKAFEDTHKPNVVSYTTLICAYLKDQQFNNALSLFHSVPERNVVTWNALIGGYSQTGKNEEAVSLFVKMLRERMVPTQLTFPCVISAASNITALGIGKSLHASAIKILGNFNVFTGNSLVTFYAKCGSMEDSLIIFNKLPWKNVVSWNAIICGYAQNGEARKAVEFFHKMKTEGIKPNSATFLGVLAACNHGGLIDEGHVCFNETRSWNPRILKAEHYGCMVDLFSRSGRFVEAERFLSSMPFSAGIGFWKTLLGGCQIHLNMDLAELAAKKILAFNPGDVSSYIMLSNAYSAAGNWQAVSRIRREMKEKGMERVPGCSWIEVKNKVHTFISWDKCHEEKDDIYFLLNLYYNSIKDNQALAMLPEE